MRKREAIALAVDQTPCAVANLAVVGSGVFDERQDFQILGPCQADAVLGKVGPVLLGVELDLNVYTI